MPEPSLRRTFLVTALVALACSLAVSVSAVALRPYQRANREPFLRRNVLAVAGLDANISAEEAFRNFVETRIVDLDTGEYAPDAGIDPATYEPARAAEDEVLGRDLPAGSDLAEIGRRERYAVVYLVRRRGRVDRIVLPVRGTGWSTVHAFVALDRDLTTVRGVVFPEHAETPGVGGEIDNAAWRARWVGKRIYGEEGGVRFRLVKGAAPDAVHDVDAVSGATLTSEGVTRLVRFWFGDLGYRRYLDRLREKGVDDD